MTDKDMLGTRMKNYEFVETSRKFDPTLPVYARIDGRSFSNFTKHMSRPYDVSMSNSMIDTMKYLVDKTNASIGYTQSDEISLAWPGSVDHTKLFFDGKVQKSCSVLAGMATAKFISAYIMNFNTVPEGMPHFDCRVFQLPSQTEVANTFLWRELDARKNAISMLARHHFSHKLLQGKSGKEMTNMLEGIGVFMDSYPDSFKRGTWAKRVTYEKMLTSDEYNIFLKQHKITIDISKPVIRSEVKVIDMPVFLTVPNREQVIFDV